MKTTFFILTIICLAFSRDSYAQYSLTGIIRLENNTPVPNATVLLHSLSDSSRPIISFTTSDSKGFYSLKIPNLKAIYSVTIRAGSYKETEKTFNFMEDSLVRQFDFVLLPSISYLDTVRIDMKFTISVTGDTLTFNPDAYSRKNETTIEQLLRNIPGIDIKDNGKITFNGTSVSGVLIDGDDLFKRNYQQLTQNAAPKIIDKIEVIKNYQKDKLLKEFNQGGSQIINLKLKEEFKNYLFGNATVGAGSEKNKLADLFLIKLFPQTKVQAGINHNTTGTTYSAPAKFNIDDYFEQNEKAFFSYRAVAPLININNYYFQNIPSYYQQKNRSTQAYSNVLIKKNKWEHSINIKISEDTLRNRQNIHTNYSDGKIIFENNAGAERNRLQEYQYSASKSTEKESLYFNTSLNQKNKRYQLNTESNQSLNTFQLLQNSNLSWQLNLSYIRKLKPGILWTNTFGYFNQSLYESLQTNPDFLFWLFPDHLSLNRLYSDGNIKFHYARYKSSLILNKKRMSHQIDLDFIYDRKRLASDLEFLRISDDSLGNPFNNNSIYHQSSLSFGYTAILSLSKGKSFTIKVLNEPAHFRYRLTENQVSTKNQLLYDYSGAISSKARNGSWSVNIGIKNQLEENNLFYGNYVQNSFHSLRSGFTKPYSSNRIYTQLFYNSISLKRQMISSFMVNLSHNQEEFIRSMNNTGIATLSSFLSYPNNTNSLMALFRTQKVFGQFPVSLNPNVIFNLRSIVYSINDQINKSDIQSLNATLGFKTLFESAFNVDYNFSVLSSVNKVQSPKGLSSSATTILNKVNAYFVLNKLFNVTLVYNNVSSRNVSFSGDFLDVIINKKMLKEKIIIEANARNLLNIKTIGNQTISPFFTQDNLSVIRGFEFFFKVRYELR